MKKKLKQKKEKRIKLKRKRNMCCKTKYDLSYDFVYTQIETRKQT